MYYGSCGSSGGSWGSSGGTVIYDGAAPAPAAPAKPGDSNLPPTPPVPGPGSESAPSPMTGEIYRSLNGGQAALLTVSVPAEAKVFINGNPTTSTGTQRQYISRGLKAGSRYNYEVRAEFVKDGQPVTDTKNVTLTAGEMAGLAFNFEGNQEDPVASGSKTKTKVTLHVPADAKVYLSGRETTSTGDVREFATSKLAPGAEWNDYTVKVVANIDGREVSKEQTITLTGGEDRELTFDFGSDAIASTAAVTR